MDFQFRGPEKQWCTVCIKNMKRPKRMRNRVYWIHTSDKLVNKENVIRRALKYPQHVGASAQASINGPVQLPNLPSCQLQSGNLGINFTLAKNPISMFNYIRGFSMTSAISAVVVSLAPFPLLIALIPLRFPIGSKPTRCLCLFPFSHYYSISEWLPGVTQYCAKGASRPCADVITRFPLLDGRIFILAVEERQQGDKIWCMKPEMDQPFAWYWHVQPCSFRASSSSHFWYISFNHTSLHLMQCNTLLPRMYGSVYDGLNFPHPEMDSVFGPFKVRTSDADDTLIGKSGQCRALFFHRKLIIDNFLWQPMQLHQ